MIIQTARYDMAPRTIAIVGGVVLTEEGLVRADLVIEHGLITALGTDLVLPEGATVLEAEDCIVGPGFVDLHTHLREPGKEQAETIATGARAAALGGYTAVVAMPNTDPVLDSAFVVRAVLDLGAVSTCEVAVAGAITLGRKGESLAPIAELAKLGVQLFTDDGSGVQHGGVARRALDYCRGLGVTYAEHCEDDAIAAGGVVHEGEWSAKLGLPGQPASAEEAMVARDLLLAGELGARLHLLHLSTSGSVELVRQAKNAGINVTAEAAPHHFTLTDAALESYDAVFKVNPPLRPEHHVQAIIDGFADGTIDAVATDHAPHTPETKDLPFDEAPPGMLGLETAFSLTYERLVLGAKMSIEQLFAVMSMNPARIAGLDAASSRPYGHTPHGKPVAVGNVANLVVIDPEATWTVEGSSLASLAANTPYEGRTMHGAIRHTVLRGEPVVLEGKATR